MNLLGRGCAVCAHSDDDNGQGTTSTPRVANFSNKHGREEIDMGGWVGKPLRVLPRFTSVSICYGFNSMLLRALLLKFLFAITNAVGLRCARWAFVGPLCAMGHGRLVREVLFL